MTKFIVLSGKKQAGKTTAAEYIADLLYKIEAEQLWEKNVNKAKKANDVGEWVLPETPGVPIDLVKVTSFATPIKEFCTDVIGLTHEQVYGSDEGKNSETHIRWDTMPDEIRVRYGRFLKENEVIGTPSEVVDKWGYNPPKVPKSGLMTAREVMQIFGTDIFRNFFDYDIWAKAPFNKYEGSKHKYVIIDDCRFPNEAKMALDNDALLVRLTRNVLGDDVHVSEKAMDDYPIDEYHYVIDNHLYDDIDCLFKDLKEIIRKEFA